MASSQRPRMSLPPELSAIDDAWGEDEHTTLPRPSRMPTAPARADLSELTVTAPPPTGIELEVIDDDDDPQERVTSAARVHVDEYAMVIMSREAQQAVTEPPPFGSTGLDIGEFRLELGIGDGRLSFPPNEAPTVIGPPSQAPTAPPPMGFDSQRARTLRNVGFEDNLELELDLPPIISNASHAIPPRRTPPSKSPHQTMKDRFAMGDFSGALDVAEQILNREPNDMEARSLSEKCRDVLLDMYSSRISAMDRIPQICMSPDQIRWLSLDHRAGFMLSMIDGISSVDDLLDVSGMQRLDALRILCSLLDQKVILLT